MATPLVEALAKGIPTARIDLLVSPASRGVFEGNPGVRAMFMVPPKPTPAVLVSMAKQLRSRSYDYYLGCLPSNTLRQILLSVVARVQTRVKHRSPHRGFRNVDWVVNRLVEIPPARHRIDCNLDLLRAIGISVDDADRSPRIYVGPEEENRADGWILEAGTGGSFIGFHPGCNPAAAFKRWAPDNYAKLADFLSDRYGARILIVGGPDEREDVEKLKLLMRAACIDLVGRCTLLETAAVIKRCRCFVTNDSGIMHLATAVGVPTFAIFGPKDERHIGPYGSAHTVIRNGTDVNNVTVDQVISVIESSPHGPAAW